MAWLRHHGSDDLDRILGSLPDPYVVTALGRARFVLGPSGAHVIALDDGTPAAPSALARLASVIRSALAERIAWVPFIDALLVTERDEPCPPATRVPHDLIASALVDGPDVITPNDLARLLAAVREGTLIGLEAVAPGHASEQLSTS